MNLRRVGVVVIWAPFFACSTFGSSMTDDAGTVGVEGGADVAALPVDGPAPPPPDGPAPPPESPDASIPDAPIPPVPDADLPDSLVVDALPPPRDARPDGPAGLTAMRVFLTPEVYPASFAGSGQPWDEADARCAASAQAKGVFGATWRAWISHSGGDAISRLPNDVYWYQPSLGNPVVFASKAGIVSGGPLAPILADAAGGLVPRAFGSEHVWTGTAQGGTASNACVDWTRASGAVSGVAGKPDSLSPTHWTNYLLIGCDSAAYHFYCFEVP